MTEIGFTYKGKCGNCPGNPDKYLHRSGAYLKAWRNGAWRLFNAKGIMIRYGKDEIEMMSELTEWNQTI